MMRSIALLCALAVAACASSPKRAAEAERPVLRVVIAKYDVRPITFTVAGAWAPIESEKGTSNTIVLQHLDRRGSAIAVSYDAADPGTTVEAQVARWAMILLSGQMIYAVNDVTAPVYLSEEDGSFTLTGVDEGVPMATKCRIKLASGNGESYWVAIFSVTSAATSGDAFKEVDRIAESLKVHPIPPK